MIFDKHAHETFWRWIAERYRIHQLKEAGLPKPWSMDPIFQTWKFCNVFRTDDKQTRWLINNVINPHWNSPLPLMIFNLFAFRAFNWANTFSAITREKNWIDNWDEQDAKTILWNLSVNQHKQLTSGAYMIRGREGQSKYESIPETLEHIWNMKDYLAERIMDEPIETMEDMQDLLLAQKFWGWGPFTTYQVVLDLTYTRILNQASDLNSWCEFGPGAKRGIRCIWPEVTSGKCLSYALHLYETQDDFRDRDVPRMTLQDIEFCLCELSKYLRIERGGRSKEKYAGL